MAALRTITSGLAGEATTIGRIDASPSLSAAASAVAESATGIAAGRAGAPLLHLLAWVPGRVLCGVSDCTVTVVETDWLRAETGLCGLPLWVEEGAGVFDQQQQVEWVSR